MRAREFGWGLLACVAWAVSGCGESDLERAAATYKRDRDCPSLGVVSKQAAGLKRDRVLELLGPPDYEPTAGQHYYSSTRKDCSLVLDYRRKDQTTDVVQSMEFGHIGE